LAGSDAIVVVGSQAILAQFPDAPAELLVSQEADVYRGASAHAPCAFDHSLWT
jgi:hypothetical protein